jgi:pantoate--beta-alanine ligase
MHVLQSIPELHAFRTALAGGVGFVPSLGGMHEGHASLIRRSTAENEHTLVSIFVNPAQFGPGEDYERYPRNMAADLDLCRECGASAVFTPSPEVMYPPGFSTWVAVEGLTDKLCGRARPGHFRGVTTVVAKLFHLVQPTRAYFGRKDAQQAIVLARMARDLNMPVEIITCPTVREADGLAMSTRNRYLSPDERQRALCLWRALKAIELAWQAGNADVAALREIGLKELQNGADTVDYLEILDAEDLSEIARVERPALVAVAARIGTTRLIDNLVLG